MTLRPEHVREVEPGITRIAVPTPFAVGRVNCYLIEDDPLTLVDTGPNSGTSLVDLEAGVRLAGRSLDETERIVLTHQHMDHLGLAQIVADRSGAEIACFSLLGPWLADFAASMESDDRFAEAVMERHGFPHDLILGLRAVARGVRAWGAAAEAAVTFSDGDTIGFAGREWHVAHRPGHSPSDCVFHDHSSGILIGGDHLLATISSNPLIARPLDSEGPPEQVERPAALEIYLRSMRQTAAMDVTTVHPGHGEPIDDHRDLIEKRIAGHQRRAERIVSLIGDGVASAHDLALAMWGAVAITQAYLTLSEILGHIDLLEAAGTVVRVEGDDDIVRFARA